MAATAGATYAFRVRAVDRAGNEEAEHSQADASTEITGPPTAVTLDALSARAPGAARLWLLVVGGLLLGAGGLLRRR